MIGNVPVHIQIQFVIEMGAGDRRSEVVVLVERDVEELDAGGDGGSWVESQLDHLGDFVAVEKKILAGNLALIPSAPGDVIVVEQRVECVEGAPGI